MRSHLILTGLLSSLGSLASMGCSISATPDGPDAEATSSTATALVVIERTLGPGDAVRGDAVIARFVRVRQGAVDEQALRLAGAAWDLPAPGTCSSAQPPEPALQPRGVDLLDVGALTVGERENGGAPTARTTVLLPRTMPDPTGVVSGVFYSARSAEGFTPASRLQLLASGGPDLPEGFLVEVPAPRDVSDVRVSSAEPANGRPGGLDVSWEPADGDDARDLVYVDVLSASAHLVARCATFDVGHLVVPGGTLGATDEGTLSVHRLHRVSFRTKGIEPGEIRFDVARAVTFRR